MCPPRELPIVATAFWTVDFSPFVPGLYKACLRLIGGTYPHSIPPGGSAFGMGGSCFPSWIMRPKALV